MGELVGVLFGIALIWLGAKGFSEKGIPTTRNGGLSGTRGKVVGIIFVLWGTGIVVRFIM